MTWWRGLTRPRQLAVIAASLTALPLVAGAFVLAAPAAGVACVTVTASTAAVLVIKSAHNKRG